MAPTRVEKKLRKRAERAETRRVERPTVRPDAERCAASRLAASQHKYQNFFEEPRMDGERRGGVVWLGLTEVPGVGSGTF